MHLLILGQSKFPAWVLIIRLYFSCKLPFHQHVFSAFPLCPPTPPFFPLFPTTKTTAPAKAGWILECREKGGTEGYGAGKGGCHSTMRRNARGAMRMRCRGISSHRTVERMENGRLIPSLCLRIVRWKEKETWGYNGNRQHVIGREGKPGEGEGEHPPLPPGASKLRAKLRTKKREGGLGWGGGGEGAGRPPPSRRPGGSGGAGQVQVRGAAQLFDLAVPPSDRSGHGARPPPPPSRPRRRIPGAPLPRPGLPFPPSSRPTHTPPPHGRGGSRRRDAPGPSRPPLPPRTCGHSAPARGFLGDKQPRGSRPSPLRRGPSRSPPPLPLRSLRDSRSPHPTSTASREEHPQ